MCYLNEVFELKIESAPEEPIGDDASASEHHSEVECELDEDQIRADKLAEDERRQQQQKQREIEMARLAELEEIAAEEKEAELARQASELAGNAE